MSDVDRFYFDHGDYGDACITHTSDGDWVAYEDYAKLERRIKKLEAEKRAAEAEAGKQICRNTELELAINGGILLLEESMNRSAKVCLRAVLSSTEGEGDEN